MANVAILARSMGHEVSGSDSGIYPPMSAMLQDQDIRLVHGYSPEGWTGLEPDLVLVGNALSRGNPSLEHVLDQRLPFNSGAQWLAENVLPGRRVLAVAGTHGKTTTTAMLAWILQCQGLGPGYLIGGIAGNFREPAALGEGELFVVEADEYDTAFSDKRSKFVHYRPEVLVCNKLEFDHADIFQSVDDIYRQFHHLVRTMSGKGAIITDAGNEGMKKVLDMGCWSRLRYTGAGSDWQVHSDDPSWQSFELRTAGHGDVAVSANFIGRHNAENALAAIVAAHEVGVDPGAACQAMSSYKPAARRLELIFSGNDTLVYSDFAHHPTAIRATIQCLGQAFPGRRLIAVLEPASYTMRNQRHGKLTEEALAGCGHAFVYLNDRAAQDGGKAPCLAGGEAYDDADKLHDKLLQTIAPGDVVVMMSNAGFGGLLQKLPASMAAATQRAVSA